MEESLETERKCWVQVVDWKNPKKEKKKQKKVNLIRTFQCNLAI